MTEEFVSLGDPAVPLDANPARFGDSVGASYEASLSLGNSPPSINASEPDDENIAGEVPAWWYWGVAEAVAWLFGMLGAHIVGFILALMAVFSAMKLLTGKLPSGVDDPEVMMPLAAVEMIFFVGASALAFSLRFWGRAFRELNFSLPDPRHVAIVVLGVVPLSLCVATWSLPVQWGWHYLLQWNPLLKFIDELSSMEAVKEMAKTASFTTMVFVVAVLPAIGEELVFRGAIGRTLIANLGLWTGVIFTSIVFGLVHVHPVHAISVIPLGIAIHLLYLFTRSFWMPMLLHFLNNAWAVISTRSRIEDPTDHAGQITVLEGFELLTAILAAVLLAVALWQSRVKFVRSDGKEWNSSRFPVRVPEGAEIKRTASPINSMLWGTAIACAILCNLIVAFAVLAPAFEAV